MIGYLLCKTWNIRAVRAEGFKEKNMYDFRSDQRFSDIIPFEKKLWLSSPTMHEEELQYIHDAFRVNWVTTAGENVDALEAAVAEKTGIRHAVALSSGTAALHLSVKLAAERLYGSSTGISTPAGLGPGGSLLGKRVFCSDMTFDATVNPVVYEGGEPVFIDTEYDTWNMDPESLERAFEIYPDVKLVVLAHLYGTPGKIDALKEICREHGALLIEDAAESFGASYKGVQTGCFGDYAVISFNGNKIITGSSGGMFLTDSRHDAEKVRKWSTQAREAAPWYQHEELGYNYRMSNIIAGIARGQMEHLEEHIARKTEIYQRYREGLAGLPVTLNPWNEADSTPNFWLSCLLVDREAMCETQRSEREAMWRPERGKSCPTEMLNALASFGAEGRPLWKPMHMQSIYKNNGFVGRSDSMRGNSNAYISGEDGCDAGADLFARGLCLPSDHKMSPEEQDRVIEIVRRCFG